MFKLQVGKKYKNRLGIIIYITQLKRDMIFPFIGTYIYYGNNLGFNYSYSYRYYKNGKVYTTFNDTVESMEDLVEEYIDIKDTPTGKILYGKE